jgi:hypothetical protein
MDKLDIKNKKSSSEINIDTLDNEGKSKLMLDRFLSGEIDIGTFKSGLDVLHSKQKNYEVAGYV